MLAASLIIGLLLVKILLVKLHPRIGAILDITAVLLFFTFRFVLGKAEVFGWTFIILYFFGGIGLFLSNKLDTVPQPKIS
jgi:hypothetical protein